MVENADEVIEFIHRLRAAWFTSKDELAINFREVTNLGSDALTVLFSQMAMFQLVRKRNISMYGPRDPNIQAIFDRSGFGALVRNYPHSDEPVGGRVDFSQQHGKLVKADLALKLVQFATHILYSEPRYHQPSQRALIESMDNTHDHAVNQAALGRNDEEEIPDEDLETWWASVYTDADQSKARFTVADTGVGILESQPMTRWRRLPETKGLFPTNVELMKALFDGTIKSRTQKANRGRWFPNMKELAQVTKRLQNVTVISNDVYVNLSHNEFRKLKRPFPGTFIYWELQKEQ